MEQYNNQQPIVVEPVKEKKPIGLQIAALVFGIVGLAFAFFAYFITIFSNIGLLAQFPPGLEVGGHPPVAARREGHGADFRTVGQAGTLELLLEEAAQEGLQPLAEGRVVIAAGEGLAGQE